MEDLIFRVEDFEGPLDLLVYLVRRKKMDIRNVQISVLADEFMSYIDRMRRLDLNVSADFMATASYLMDLKSKALLPHLSAEEKRELEEKKERLVETIERYGKIKELVDEIAKRDFKPRYPVRVLPRPNFDLEKVKDLVEGVVKTVEIKERVYRIKSEGIGVDEMMERIMRSEFPIILSELFSRFESRYEMVVALLAILELLSVGRLKYEDGRLVLP